MAGPRFRADSPQQLKRVELDGLSVVFHRPSGMTHIVAPPAPQILELLAREPLSASDLLARLSTRFDIEDADFGSLEARLAELVAAGLVWRE